MKTIRSVAIAVYVLIVISAISLGMSTYMMFHTEKSTPKEIVDRLDKAEIRLQENKISLIQEAERAAAYQKLKNDRIDSELTKNRLEVESTRNELKNLKNEKSHTIINGYGSTELQRAFSDL